MEKKILVTNSVHTRPRQENSKKNSKKIKKIKKKKTSFQQYSYLKRDEIGQEREKKILDPNSVHTRPRQENSEKNSEKIQKFKKSLSGNIYRRNGMRKAEQE